MAGVVELDPSRRRRVRVDPDPPRFDLRFECGRGLLRLARPLEAGPVTVLALDVDVGHVGVRLDLSEGAARFRQRRGRVRRAEVRVDLRGLYLAAARIGIGAKLHVSEHRTDLALRDGYGVLGARVWPLADGSDLLLVCEDVRCASDGPASPWRRWVVAARRLGFGWDEARGALRWRRPLHDSLVEALVPRGWRVPDERGLPVQVRVSPGGDALELTVPAADSGGGGFLPRSERARRLAPVWGKLVLDELHAAVDRLAAVRFPQAGASVRALSVAIDAERGERHERVREALRGPGAAELDQVLVQTLALRLALRENDHSEMASLARAVADVEPCDALAADALALVARELADSQPAVAQDLLVRAVARAPERIELVETWLDVAERTGRDRGLEALVRSALAVSEARPRLRGLIAARGAERLLARGASRETPLPRETVRTCRSWLEDATALAPEEPRVQQAWASWHERVGEPERSIQTFDRAADGWIDRGQMRSAAQALARSADLLERLDRLDGAVERLERAVGHVRDEAAMVARLAELQRRRGEVGAASDAYARLLGMEGRVEELAPALQSAALFHLDEPADAIAARPFVERLGRLAGAEAVVDLDELEAQLARAEAAAWLDEPEALLQADVELLERIARDAPVPERAYRVLVEHLDRVGDAEPWIHAACAAARRAAPSALAELARSLVGSRRLPRSSALLEELAVHATEDETRRALEVAREGRGDRDGDEEGGG